MRTDGCFPVRGPCNETKVMMASSTGSSRKSATALPTPLPYESGSGRIFTGVTCTEVSFATWGCTDCETGKRQLTDQRKSPVKVHGTYPFLAIYMDHITSLPKHLRRNTELLTWADLVIGYVIAWRGRHETSKSVREIIMHDRVRGFMTVSSFVQSNSEKNKVPK
ncbi:reverse transcriptase [Phytophthora megakarya]|uniref:Reverse transcriptase n=1 Tax=Phytophthora megakarya TaxID=4795 RepID=A0A225W9T5_9STRA|nr:reverse transcriptase [Phytophthora megakarya]